MVTNLDDGGFVVAWESNNQDGDGYGIYAQRYDEYSNTVGEEFLVNTYTENDQTDIAMTALNNGSFIVTWLSQNQALNGQSLHAQMFDDSGNKAGDELLITSLITSPASIKAMGQFEFIVAWEFEDVVYTQVLDADGGRLNTVTVAEIANDTPIDNTSTISQPLDFTYETLSAKVASIQKYGDDYSLDPSATVIKLTLSADMANVTDIGVNSITGAEIDLNIDWTQFEVMSYNDGSSQLFESINSINTPSVWQTYNDSLGNLNKLVVGSVDTAANPAKTLVDNVESTGLGVVTDRPSSLELGSIYLKPIAGLEVIDFSYEAIVMTDEGSQSFNQTSTTISIDTTLTSAIITTTNNEYLDNIELLFFKDGVDTGVSSLVEEGGIKIDTSVEFDSIILSVDNAYQGDLNIIDMYGVLDNIAQDIDTYAEHASDSNNDGEVNIVDMYGVLNGIGQASQSFDLVDQNGILVTSFNTNSSDIANWTIVANGDVDLSGVFSDEFVVSVDIV